LLGRIEDPNKNWKFSEGDVSERKFWNEYRKAYEDALSNTSTGHAPWYVLPADHKWFTRVSIADVIVEKAAIAEVALSRSECETEGRIEGSKKAARKTVMLADADAPVMREFLFDLGVDLGVSELGGNTDRVLDRVCV